MSLKAVEKDAACWISHLGLERHPEGGWFRETYRSTESVPADALPERFGGSRSLSTAILFLLEQGAFSALHRIKSDEIWHFHEGAPLTVHVIDSHGAYYQLRLGRSGDAGELFQAVVPAGCWFGAETTGDYSLVGCTVAPGFDFADFRMADKTELMERFPEYGTIIGRLTR